MSLKEIYSKLVEERVNSKPTFNILLVTDNASRLSVLRGSNAFDEFKNFYGNIANIQVVTMASNSFINMNIDISLFNVLWIDNIANQEFNSKVIEYMKSILDKNIPTWKSDFELLTSEDDKHEYSDYLNKIRSIYLRVIYALDEYVWEGVGGRAKTVGNVSSIETCIENSDTVIVPNGELSAAIKDLGFVSKDKETLIIPTFASDIFYPINKIQSKCGFSVNINKPKILIKGTIIPQHVQEFIIKTYNKFDITISSIGELDEHIMGLIQNKKIKNIQHWSNPYVNSRNILKTMAIERDVGFDFTLLTLPNDIDIYNLTTTDTDAVISIASGSLTFAEVDDAGYKENEHICLLAKTTFGRNTTAKELETLITKWSVCANWDSAFQSQRKLLSARLISSPVILAGYFSAMLGRDVALSRHEKYTESDKETTGVVSDTNVDTEPTNIIKFNK
jgi:hypothetical protein